MPNKERLPNREFITELAVRATTGTSEFDKFAEKIADAVANDEIKDMILAPREFVMEHREATLAEMEKRDIDPDARIMLGSSFKASSLIAHSYMHALSLRVTELMAFLMASMITEANYERGKKEILGALKEELTHIVHPDYIPTDEKLDEFIRHHI